MYPQLSRPEFFSNGASPRGHIFQMGFKRLPVFGWSAFQGMGKIMFIARVVDFIHEIVLELLERSCYDSP